MPTLFTLLAAVFTALYIKIDEVAGYVAPFVYAMHGGVA